MLFSCSIRDNIAYGADDPEAVTIEEIYTAAREANAYNFVKSFPQGFDTVVGEKGVLLSGQNVLTVHLLTDMLCRSQQCSLCFFTERHTKHKAHSQIQVVLLNSEYKELKVH